MTPEQMRARTCENCGASFTRTQNPGKQAEKWVHFARRRYCSHECSRGNRPGWNTEQRFMAKVLTDDAGCWIWQAHINNQGYGVFSRHYLDNVYAHRWAYENFIGPIPTGLELDHLCRVTACCNPEHLEPVTGAENKRRAVQYRTRSIGPRLRNGRFVARRQKRRQACSHEMDPDNTITRSDGVRWCRACREALYQRMRAEGSG